jgi:hypothetical protein
MNPFRELDVNGSMLLKWISRKISGCGMTSSGSVKEIMADVLCKLLNYLVQKCRELNELKDYQLLFHAVS